MSGRTLRTGAAAAAAAWLTAYGHALAGGRLPDLLGLAVVAVATWAVATWLGRRPRRLPAAVAALAALQAGTHTWLEWSAGACSSLAAGGHAGHLAHTGHTAHGGVVATCTAHAGHASASSGLAMVLAHAAAVVATAVLLHLADRGTTGLAHALRVRPALPGALPTLPVAVPVPRPPRAVQAHGARRVVVTSVSRRGPPALSRMRAAPLLSA